MKVIISADGLMPDDYIRAGCDAALAASPRRCKSDYEMALGGRVEAAQTAGDEQAANAARIMHAAMAIRTPWNKASIIAEDDPFWPTFEFDESAYDYLSRLLGLDPLGESWVADNEARGRAGDLLYQRSVSTGGKRNFRAAAVAIDGYLTEAKHQAELNHWSHAMERVARAFGIAAELNSKPLRDKVVGHIKAALDAYSLRPELQSAEDGLVFPAPVSPSRYPLQLMRLLLAQFKKGDSVEWATLAEHLAQNALMVKKWDLGRDYLGVAAQWHARTGDLVRELAAQERAAEAWVEQGNAMVAAPDTHDLHYMMAECKLSEGIQSLRAAMGLASTHNLLNDVTRLSVRIEVVRQLHLQFQERGIKAIPTYRNSATIDSGPIFAVVEGKEKIEALFAMAAMPLPTQAEVEAMVRDEQEKYLFSRFFSLVQLEERGRTAARSGTGDNDTWARICQRAVMLYEIRAQILVEPHRWMITKEHAVDIKDFAMLTHASPFVPAGRELLFARGLHAGMKGDFGLAVHLLIPQIENALRVLIRETTPVDEVAKVAHAEMIADPEQPSLGAALRGPWASELARALGEDSEAIVFALRVLLVERFGGNLRNRVFHGLTGYVGVANWQCWYLWWIVMKIVFLTARVAVHKIATDGP